MISIPGGGILRFVYSILFLESRYFVFEWHAGYLKISAHYLALTSRQSHIGIPEVILKRGNERGYRGYALQSGKMQANYPQSC